MSNCHAIFYNQIGLVDNTIKEHPYYEASLTITVSANSISEYRTNYPVLLHLDDRTGGASVFKLIKNKYWYLYAGQNAFSPPSGSTNIRPTEIYDMMIEEWDYSNKVCRLWVILPFLDHNQKDFKLMMNPYKVKLTDPQQAAV